MNRVKYAGGKYWACYMPEHPDAMTDGYVYEHRLVAERMLHRRLSKKEYVHHKDDNGLNNKPSNLMIFASNADHIRHHKGGKITCVNGVWYAKSANPTCKVCGKLLLRRNKTQLCRDCINKQLQTMHPSKTELERMLYRYSLLYIGKQFGVSDNAVRKWLKRYELPIKRKDILEWRKRYIAIMSTT